MNIHKHKVAGIAVTVAVLGAVIFGGSVLYSQPSALASETATDGATVQAFDFAAFKRAFIKEGATDIANSKKLEWVVTGGNTKPVDAAIATLKTHIGAIADDINAVTPQASKMAILRDIAVFVDASNTATKEAVIAEANESVALHKATRKLIDVFVIRDDNAPKDKKDTWTEQITPAQVQAFVAAYKDIHATAKGRATFESQGFKADYFDNLASSGKLEQLLQKTLVAAKAGNKKNSVLILAELRDQIAAAEAPAVVGNAAAAVSDVSILDAGPTNKLRLKVDTITNDNPAVIELLKATEGTAAVAFSMDLVDSTNHSVIPTKPVAITLTLTGNLKTLFDNNQNVVLYHVTDGKNEEVAYTRKDDAVTFTAASFSPYVFVAKKANTAAPHAAAPATTDTAAPAGTQNQKGSTDLADTGSAYLVPVLAGLAVTGLGIALFIRRS